MAGLGTLLLILIIFFLILPLLKVGLRIYGFQKKAKDAFSQFNQQQQKQAEEYESRQRRQQRQQRRKSMGEYVDFEEITDTSGSASPRQSASKKSPHPSEPLISDAEWEDIK